MTHAPPAAAATPLDDLVTPYLPEFYEGEDFDRLVESIRLHGVMAPLVVSALGNLVEGNRRLLAARKLGLATVPVTVNPLIDTPDKEAATILATEVGSPRNPLDQAKHIRRFMAAHGLDQKQTAAALKLSEALVSSHLKVLKHSAGVQAAVGDGRLTRQHLAAVVKLCDEKQDEFLLAAAAQDPVPSARKLQVLSRAAKRVKRPDPKLKKLTYAGVGLTFPAGLSAAQLLAALDEARADAAARLKAANKSGLTVKEIFSQ